VRGCAPLPPRGRGVPGGRRFGGPGLRRGGRRRRRWCGWRPIGDLLPPRSRGGLPCGADS